jgi:hypothetical protein
MNGPANAWQFRNAGNRLFLALDYLPSAASMDEWATHLG